jgi:hypothetical protein
MHLCTTTCTVVSTGEALLTRVVCCVCLSLSAVMANSRGSAVKAPRYPSHLSASKHSGGRAAEVRGRGRGGRGRGGRGKRGGGNAVRRGSERGGRGGGESGRGQEGDSEEEESREEKESSEEEEKMGEGEAEAEAEAVQGDPPASAPAPVATVVKKTIERAPGVDAVFIHCATLQDIIEHFAVYQSWLKAKKKAAATTEWDDDREWSRLIARQYQVSQLSTAKSTAK